MSRTIIFSKEERFFLCNVFNWFSQKIQRTLYASRLKLKIILSNTSLITRYDFLSRFTCAIPLRSEMPVNVSFRRFEDHGTIIAVWLTCGRIWKVRFLIYATGAIECAIRSMCLSRLWKWKDENCFRIRPTVLLCAMSNRDLENSAVITALTGTNLAAKSCYSSAICTIDPPKVHSNVQFECPAE